MQPSRIALKSGCEGVSAINTIMSVMGIDLKTLRPEPCVEGLDSVPLGYLLEHVYLLLLI
jgi:dihydropyrimidine dehydrogenase (NADP+)